MGQEEKNKRRAAGMAKSTAGKSRTFEDKTKYNRKDKWTLEIDTMVILSCNGERHSQKDVQFENIESDFEGRDVLTFKCPICENTHTSLIYL